MLKRIKSLKAVRLYWKIIVYLFDKYSINLIRKIYNWYNDRFDNFLQLKEMKERTTPNLDQIEDEEPVIEEHYVTLKEINEHRTDIKGYENANKRIIILYLLLEIIYLLLLLFMIRFIKKIKLKLILEVIGLEEQD